MAELVAGFGVSHGPHFPQLVARAGPQCEPARLYAEVAKRLEAARPDAIVLFANDHFNTFFLDNLPTFAIGVADATSGPNDSTEMPPYDVPVHRALAAHLRGHAIAAGFDLASAEEFTLDHAFMVPLHFLASAMRIPVVPIFVNAFMPPLPRAARCHALGHAIRSAIATCQQDLRVAVMCSGAFSLEVGGPRVLPKRRDNIPAPEWSARAYAHLERGSIDTLVAEATPMQIWEAGNAAGEILNWIAMLGALGERKPDYLALLSNGAHCFGAWGPAR